MSTAWRRGAVLLTAALCLSGSPSAYAADEESYPTRADVAAADARAAQASRDVDTIRAELLVASQRLDGLHIAAAQASEAFNGARWRLTEAEAAARTARLAAQTWQRRLQLQRHRLGRLLSESYQNGNAVSQVGLLLDASGAHTLLSRYSALSGAAQSMQAAYDRYDASNALAAVFRADARAAVQHRRTAANRAAELRQAAQDAVEEQANAVAEVEAQTDQLIEQLAAAQSISVEIARERELALAQVRREQAQAAALAAEKAAARSAARADAKAASGAGPRSPSPSATPQPPAPTPTRSPDPQPAPSPVPPPTTPPPPLPPQPPPPRTPPAPSGGAAAAIDFAYAQVGEPYEWGAAGPDSWDCSGLTMGAWAAGGVAIPHYTVEQYYASTPVTYSQLRPGDLIFWASDAGDPATIFHVGLYLGGNQMVHAPRTGRDVEVTSMWYWIPPTSYGRVG